PVDWPQHGAPGDRGGGFDGAARLDLGTREDAQLLTDDDAVALEVVGPEDGRDRSVVSAGQTPEAVAWLDGDRLRYGAAEVGGVGGVAAGHRYLVAGLQHSAARDAVGGAECLERHVVGL